jgi:hypothetical protein
MTSSSGTNLAALWPAVVLGRLVRDPQQPRQRRRHLDPGEVLGAGLGVDQDDGEVEREPGDVGERVRRVDGQRGEHREDRLAEQAVQRRPLDFAELVPPHDGDALVARAGRTWSQKTRVHPHEVLGGVRDPVEQLAGFQTGGRPHGDAGGDPALEAGDAHHEELVEVVGEDRQELGPLEQRDVLVHRELQHPLVELQPRDLAVETQHF